MPDKHSNNKPEVSEELIRKYLAGELDDRAMHALERQALDDPFLAEALEGYAANEPDQSAQLADLQQRLEQRVAQSEKGKLRLLYYRWASAAAILLILGLSFLWINRQESIERQKEIAKAEDTRPAPPSYKAADSTVVTQAPATSGAAVPAETLLRKTAPSPAAAPPSKPAGALHEKKQQQNDVPQTAPQQDKAADAALATAEDAAKDEITSSTMQDTAKKEASIAANQAPALLNDVVVVGYGVQKKQALSGRVSQVQLSGVNASKQFVSGKVVDKESGEPLPGVTVNADNSRPVITDNEGNFSIVLDTAGTSSLKLAAIGFNSQQLQLRQQNKNNVVIAMEPSTSALDEVVVTGVGRKSKRAARAYMRQHAQKIVVLGSSTAAGVGPKTPDSTWVSLLSAYVEGRNRLSAVTNLAVGGFNSYKILPEDDDVPFNKPDPDPEHNIDKALSLRPDMIIINMPSNDITAGFSVEEFQRNLARVTDLIRRHKIRFYVTTTQPRNTSAANRSKLQQMRDLIIRSYPDAYINCWEGLSTPDGNILPKYDSGDGVHLNGLGHQLMFERVKEKIN